MGKPFCNMYPQSAEANAQHTNSVISGGLAAQHDDDLSKPIANPLLLLGLLFHLCLEYALNIPMFQRDIMTAYVLFIDPADLTHVWCSVRCKYIPAALLRRNRQSFPPIKEQG
jgi:hypothetical protein